jgi:hypothetical protein
VFATEGVAQIAIDYALAIGAEDDGLMKIDVVGKGAERFADLKGWGDAQGVAEMNLAEFDLVLVQQSKGVRGFLELDCQMAGVVVHTEKVQAFIPRMLGIQAIEEMNRFTAGFQQAERFGFESEVHFAVGLRADARDVLDATPEVVANVFGGVGMVDGFLERAGQGADAAFDTGRQELSEEIKEAVGVIEALRRGPIRLIDLFLDACAVKLTVGKSVDR